MGSWMDRGESPLSNVRDKYIRLMIWCFRQDEHSLSVASLLERLSHALVIFVGHALRNSPTSSQPVTGATGMADLVAALIDLASLSNTSAKGSKVKDIVQAARTSLNNALNVMAAKDFIEAIASMLQSSETVSLLLVQRPSVFHIHIRFN